MRTASADDFFVTLPDVGAFRYAIRTVGDRLAIRRDYLRLTEEFTDEDADLSLYAALISTHAALCVTAPEGWEDLALIPDSKLPKVFELGALLKDKEDAIAKGAEKSGAPEGEGAGGDRGVHVPPALQPAADGPAISGDDDGGYARRPAGS